jgi:hypothetical protein
MTSQNFANTAQYICTNCLEISKYSNIWILMRLKRRTTKNIGIRHRTRGRTPLLHPKQNASANVCTKTGTDIFNQDTTIARSFSDLNALGQCGRYSAEILGLNQSFVINHGNS